MKKILSLALALALMLALTACSKPENSEASIVESTQEAAGGPYLFALDGETYVYANLFEFSTSNDWTGMAYDDGRFSVWFGFEITDDYVEGDDVWSGNFLFSYMYFPLPAELEEHINYVTEELAIEWMTTLADWGDEEITIGDFSEVMIDGETMWMLEAEAQKNGVVVKIIYWYYLPQDSNLLYFWSYEGNVDLFEEHLPEAQALIDSIRFI